jgi:hypothetical protein
MQAEGDKAENSEDGEQVSGEADELGCEESPRGSGLKNSADQSVNIMTCYAIFGKIWQII